MSRTPTAILALALLAAPALAQEAAADGAPQRFDLTGEAAEGPVTGALTRAGDAVSLTLDLGGEALELRGELAPEGGAQVGALRAARGLAGALQADVGEAWRARLAIDGPLASLRLSRGRRTLDLEGTARLGAPDAANAALIRRFYEAFARHDGEAMAASYAPDARFSDPVFPDLRGDAPGDMWAMLCEAQPQVTFSGIRADGRYAVARWEARYEVFGNPVHNVIDAAFELRDGRIVRHVDRFDFPRWSRQAFGSVVRVVPSRLVRHVVRRVVAGQLASFQRKRREAAGGH